MCRASGSPGVSGCRGAPCSHSCRFAWADRGGPGPRSAGAGTVRLQRGVTEVPGTLPRESLGRVTRRKRAAAATAERGHRLPLSVAGPGCESGLRALRLPAARVWEHEAGLLKSTSVPGAWRGVARSPWSLWTAGSFVPAPRCPLFLPSAGSRRREERGSGCPDVSALSDCAAGQSRPGVCGRGRLSARRERAPGLQRGVPERRPGLHAF